MPPITLTDAPSAPIAVPAGALLQNSGRTLIKIRVASAAADSASLRIPQNRAFRVDTALSIVAWAQGGVGELSVIEGF